jgi:uncharacterized lipoprotein YmbA
VLLLAGLTAACMGGSLPTTHYYTLHLPSDAGARASDAPGLLIGVDSIAVDPPYDQDRIVYRRGEESAEVGFYAYHRWASPLGRLLQVALADGLAGARGIGAIEPVRSGRDYDARLGGRLLFLEEVDTAEGQGVRLSIELLLRDRAGESLWSATLSSTAGRSASQVEAVVDSAQLAVAEIVARASEDLETTLAEAAPEGR